MAWQQPSPRIRELIREGARIALNPSPEWIEELDRATIAANPAIANDPVLAKVVQTANRANLVYWAAANLRDPGARVPANLGTEPLRMARDLVRRGLDTVAFNIYRTGEHIGWRFWMGIAFELTSDPQELRELLDVSARSVNDFIEATLTGIAAQVQSEHDELTRSTHAERLEVVGLILDGAPISPERAEAKLGYPLSRAHTAAIIWSDELDGDHSYLDRAADLFCHAVGSTRPLTVVAGAASRWAWVTDADGLDIDTVQAAVDNAPGARIAIGTTANGVEGFRRSHLEALITQRTLSRLRSTQRVAFFADVKMVAFDQPKSRCCKRIHHEYAWRPRVCQPRSTNGPADLHQRAVQRLPGRKTSPHSPQYISAQTRVRSAAATATARPHLRPCGRRPGSPTVARQQGPCAKLTGPSE